MKKLILAMSAFAMLFATSCVKDLATENAGETSTVTFSVATPEMATRAYSDGTTATVLQYAVYNAAGEELTDLTVTDATINGSTTVNLELTTGNSYSVIFWAAAPNVPYTVDFATKKMTVDYTNAVSNDESRDAFFKHHTFTVNGAQTETIELKRPFAQLNIGTADYAASTSAGYTPTQSSVTVPVYTTLDLVDGVVDGQATQTFALANIKKDETFPVAGNEYLAMNYLLVAADKEVVDVEFTYTDGANAKTRTVGSVPVQRNYRTNIYGNLLTSDVDINVVIEPDFDEPALELDDLHKAALNGGEITLTEDVVLTTPLEVVGQLTLNLNGKTISSEIHKSVGAVIKNNGTLTITGGTISSLGNNGGSAIANYGTLVVDNSTVNGAPREGTTSWPAYPINNYGSMTLNKTTVTGYQGCVALNAAGTTILNNCELTKNYEKTSSHVFYVDHADAKLFVNGGTYNHNGFDGSLAYVNKGEVTINGGTFNAKDGGYGFAALSAGKIFINGGNINAGLLNWGGQFVVKGGVFKSEPKNVFAEGYKAVKKDNLWYVVAEEIDAVAENLSDLSTALSEGKDVALTADIAVAKSEAVSNSYGVVGMNQLNGGVIDGNGNAVSVDAWGTWDSAINTTGGTIKNVSVTGGMRGIFISHNSSYSDKVILENVTIDGTIYTISCDQGTGKGLEAYNSTFNGWTSYAATLGDVKFDGCSFGEGQGYAFCRPYAPTVFVNCDFEAGYELEACANVTFENCRLNGVALTEANIATLVIGGLDKVTIK